MSKVKWERYEPLVCPNCATPTLIFIDKIKGRAFLTREFFCSRCHASIFIEQPKVHYSLNRPTLLSIRINEWKKRENERDKIIRRILNSVYETGYFDILDYLNLENMSLEKLEQQEEKLRNGKPLRNNFKLFMCECGTKFLFESTLDRIFCPNPQCRREYRKR